MFKQPFHQEFAKCVNDSFSVQGRFCADFEDDSAKPPVLSSSISNSLATSSELYLTHGFDQAGVLWEGHNRT